VAKLGTKKRPAVARVQSYDRAQEILSLCTARGWQVIVGVEPDKWEDVSDVETLQAREAAAPEIGGQAPGVGRNSPCPCGSGRRFKNCCRSR